jgi:hypothetical protein
MAEHTLSCRATQKLSTWYTPALPPSLPPSLRSNYNGVASEQIERRRAATGRRHKSITKEITHLLGYALEYAS